MRTLKLTALLAALIGVLALGGCGESDEDQVKSQIENLYTALGDGDAAAACELLTEDAKKQTEQSNNKSCEAEVEESAADLTDEQKDRLKNIEVADLKVDGDTATATVKFLGGQQEQIKLAKDDDEWKLSAARPD